MALTIAALALALVLILPIRLFQRLEEMGIEDGDIVSLYNLEFEYQH